MVPGVGIEPRRDHGQDAIGLNAPQRAWNCVCEL